MTTGLVNGYLVRREGGWQDVTDIVSVSDHGRREAFLQLGDARSYEEALRETTGLLLLTRTAGVAAAATLVPADEDRAPYVGFLPYDTIDLPDLADAQVQAITVHEVDGHVEYVVEAGGLVKTASRDLSRLTRRMLPGTLGGATEVATPARPASLVEDVAVGGDRLRFSKDGPLADGSPSSNREVLGSGVHHLAFLTATLTEASTTDDVEFELRMSGSALYGPADGCVIPVGTEVLYLPLLRDVALQGDRLGVDILVPGDAVGAVFTVRYL